MAVKLGTTGHTWAQQHLGVELVVLGLMPPRVLEVVRAKPPPSSTTRSRSTSTGNATPTRPGPSLKPIQAETWAIGLRASEKELLGRINAFLAESRAKGLFDNLAGRYMADERRPLKTSGSLLIS
ncbi:MAG: hypothetical protein R3F31_23090 [Verrucomicrobiales bacterium]